MSDFYRFVPYGVEGGIHTTIREQAAQTFDHTVVGKLKRLKDVGYGVGNNHYPLWTDEAGNEYLMSDDGKTLECIVTDIGGVM